MLPATKTARLDSMEQGNVNSDSSLNGRYYDVPGRTSNDGIFWYFLEKFDIIKTSINEDSTKLLTITKQNVGRF